MRYVGLILRIAGMVLGLALILVGLPLLVTPIPVGLILVVLGIVVLTASSTHAQRWVRRRRERHPHFDARLRRIEDQTPAFFRGLLTSTRPRGAK
jgi:hypothetical protein